MFNIVCIPFLFNGIPLAFMSFSKVFLSLGGWVETTLKGLLLLLARLWRRRIRRVGAQQSQKGWANKHTPFNIDRNIARSGKNRLPK